MKKLLWLGVALGAVVLLPAPRAEALTITPSSPIVLSGNQTSQSAIDAYIAATLGDAGLLYKQNVGGPEEGSLAGSYTTTFSNTVTQPEDATITYVAGMQYVGPTSYLLVKDGNNSPAWYLFNLSNLGWDGKETLNLQDFWVGRGAISHVTLYGTALPEPATLSLLAVGLVGTAVLRRRRSQAA